MATEKLFFSYVYALILAGFFAVGHSYKRPPPRENVRLKLLEDANATTPQQVHISIVSEEKMRITWITEEETASIVNYSTTPGIYNNSANGNVSSYHYLRYRSGNIHNVVIGPLTPNTLYYYICSSNSARNFTFKTPPARFPINFAVVGDLGQTGWTKTTLDHISKSGYDMLLLPGDLAYADTVQSLWDSFGRLVEPVASQRPWMVTQGNHEVEHIPIFHRESFTAYNARWLMPFEQSGSTSNLYYSFNVAGVHVIMLGSYTDFDPNSDQYKWLEADFGKIDRGKTPWTRVYEGKADNCAPIYINIGDGGNREGPAKLYIEPKPEISVFREASFGHGELEVVNSTHALWTWHRNDDDQNVIADTVSLTSLSSTPACKI